MRPGTDTVKANTKSSKDTGVLRGMCTNVTSQCGGHNTGVRTIIL